MESGCKKLDNNELMKRITKALNDVACEPLAFMNQHDINQENIQIATLVYIENCLERIVNEPPELLYVILQTMAASSFGTGFLLGYQMANDRRD